ncbi:hypothetical protein SUGI_0254940 [Cryptomeria japonica]|nr:hypothetical protein SUGI_0254940 [Cryptomeria japonica]
MATRLLFVKRLSRWVKATTKDFSSSSFLSSDSIYALNGLYIGARILYPTTTFTNPRWSELNHHSSCNGRRNITLLALNDLIDNKGAKKKKMRKGRGIGLGKGKIIGRGHKEQREIKGVKLGFEGGQTPLQRKLPVNEKIHK